MCVPHVDFRIQWKKTAILDSVAPERLADVLLITYNYQRQLQCSLHLAGNTSYPLHAPHGMIADHVQTGKSHHGQSVPTLTGTHFMATFLFHIGSQTGESNGEITGLKAGHNHAGAEQFQRSEEGDNRAP